MHMSVEDTVDAIHDAGGLAVIAHPFMPTWFASMTPSRARSLLESRRVDGIELRHTAPVLPRTWGLLDTFYAEHRDRLGAALGAGDSHFGAHDLGPRADRVPGKERRGPAARDRGADDLAAVRRGGAVASAHSECGSPSSTGRWCGSAASGARDGSVAVPVRPEGG